MMEDCSASTGILVCPKGYTKAAKKRAQNYIRLKVVSLDEVEYKCNCDSPWYWLTAIEEDEDLGANENVDSSVYLLLCTLTTVLVADRKPLK
jgi:hypothetical protein